MKPRIGVYLSDGTAARLNDAATRPGATKSALVEKALDQLLGSDDGVSDTATLTRQLSAMSGQLEQLDRNLRIVSEAVALHARFHLTVTPILPATAQGEACGSEPNVSKSSRRRWRGVSIGELPLFGKRSTGSARQAPPLLKTKSGTARFTETSDPPSQRVKMTRCRPRARPRDSWRQTSPQTPG